MNNREFIEKVEYEGMGYALTSYFSEEEIESLEDETMRVLARQAQRALQTLEQYINDIQEELFEDDELDSESCYDEDE